ncbi:uncharacterized protein LOC124813452 isoform X2 [Hydra vulgaris]|uniref:uncharacterized protein LOC124813452 isoform X2 n=1 Tax=Hydra vulgaris TaxID=6087 RepID=UPI001F5F15A3|nr:uncharacterized protein LOC124813452 [Hydra vulgaris]
MQCKQKRARNSYLPLSDTDICSSPEINFCLQKGNSQLAKPKKNLSKSLAQKSHKKLSIEYEDLPEPPVFSNSHLNFNTPEHVTSRSSSLPSILSSFSKPHGKPLLKEFPLCSSDGWLYSVATPVEQKLILLLEEIKAQGDELKEQGEKAINLLQHLPKTNDGESLIRGLPFQLPATTVEELNLINDQAKESDIKGRLTRFLGLVGGLNVKSTTRAVLSRLLITDVAKSCNWKGKGNKIAFSKMYLVGIVCDAVRRNPATSQATDNEIGVVCRDWFKHASDRDGGRQRRANRLCLH